MMLLRKGYFWVKVRDKDSWEPAFWNNSYWMIFGISTLLLDKRIKNIGPEIVFPKRLLTKQKWRWVKLKGFSKWGWRAAKGPGGEFGWLVAGIYNRDSDCWKYATKDEDIAEIGIEIEDGWYWVVKNKNGKWEVCEFKTGDFFDSQGFDIHQIEMVNYPKIPRPLTI